MAPANIHGTALVLGDRGILVTGRSGAGKTALALALLRPAGGWHGFRRLVADDRLLVESRHGRLVCRAPSGIAGLVEVSGLGPCPVAHEPAAVIDLVIRLVPDASFQRMQDETVELVAGCAVPRIDCAERNCDAAVTAVSARLQRHPFDQGWVI